MQRYSFPTSTIGGFRCIRELDDRITLMRRFRGENVYPIVQLTRTHMPTKYGGRERPHLEIKGDWRRIGGGEAEALPSPQAPSLPPEQEQAASPPQQEQATSPPQAQAVNEAATIKTQRVSEPTLQEELNDKNPW